MLSTMRKKTFSDCWRFGKDEVISNPNPYDDKNKMYV